MNIQNIIKRFTSCPDTESEQGVIRLSVILVIIAYLYLVGSYQAHMGGLFLLFSWAAFINAVVIIVWIYLYPQKSIFRRIYSLFSDNIFTSTLLFFGEEQAIILFTVYIWITIGYGFRFGIYYLHLSQFVSVLFFSIVVLTSDYWRLEALPFSMGVLLSMIVVPMYTTKLISNLRSALDHADKANRSKDLFLANMSHEIRTPLNGILGYIGLMHKEELSDKLQNFMVPMEHSARNLARVINDILDFSKIEAGELTIKHEPLNLKETIEATIAVLELQASRKGLKLTVEMKPEVPRIVCGDETRLAEIITNLVNNAIKFTNSGVVSLAVEVIRKEGKRHTVRFIVTDTGVGIPEEKIKQIFRPFKQLDSGMNRKFEGTGLGLSITRGLVDKMEGHISVESKLEKFTRIMVDLPLSALDIDDEVSIKRDQTQERVFDAKGLKVLVIDDNEINRDFLKTLLVSFGFSADTAESGKVALTLCRKNRYVIVFIDIHMPDMDGIEIARRLRDIPTSGPPKLIAVTADIIGHRQGELSSGGFDGVLIKPVEESSLLDLIDVEISMADVSIIECEPIPEGQPDLPKILDSKKGIRLASGNEELWQSSVSRLLGSLPDQIKSIKESGIRVEGSCMCDIAHRIIGTAQYVGADSLALVAKRLEECAQSGTKSGCVAEISSMEQAYIELRDAFESLVSAG